MHKCKVCGATGDQIEEVAEGFSDVTIHTSSGEVKYEGGKEVSNTTHPGPAKPEVEKIVMPTIQGGTSVGQTNPPDPESMAEKEARIRKAERDAYK